MAQDDHDDSHILPDGPRREGLLVLGLAEVAAPEDSLVWSLLGAAERQFRRREEGVPAGGLMTLKLRSLTPRLAPLIRQARHTVLLQGFQRTAESTPSILRQRLKAAGGVWTPALSMPPGVRDPHQQSDLWSLAQERLGSSPGSGSTRGGALWHPDFDPLTNLRATDGETAGSTGTSGRDGPRNLPESSASAAAGSSPGSSAPPPPVSPPVSRRTAPPESGTPPADDPAGDPAAQRWPAWLAESSGPTGIEHCRIALPAKGDLAWVFPEMGIWFPEVVMRVTGILGNITHDRPDGGTGLLDSGHVA